MSDRNATVVVYESPRVFTLREHPIPEIGPDDLLLEVELAGIDGSELKGFNGEIPLWNEKAPLVFGDEVVGRVAAIGDAAAASRGLTVGDRITIDSRWPCTTGCRNCDAGHYFVCENNIVERRAFGSISLADGPGLWGTYATHVYVPKEALVYRIPDRLPAKTALFAGSVLANGIRWTRESGAAPDTTVVVIGPGPQGLACVIPAVRAGARVVLVGLERDAERLAVGKQLGAEETVAIAPNESVMTTASRIQSILGRVDIAIDIAGFLPARQLAHEVVAPLGTVTHVALPNPLMQEVDWYRFLRREVRVLSLYSHPHTIPDSLQLAVDLLDEGVDLGDLVTHTFALRDAAQGIEVAGNKTAESPIKVALDPSL